MRLLFLAFTSDLNSQRQTNEIAIREVAGKGLGAFALQSFNEGATVGDYVGEILTRQEADFRYKGKGWREKLWRTQRTARGVTVTGNYLFQVDDDVIVDAEDPSEANWTRYINHSADPNLRVKSLPVAYGGQPRVWFVALKNIKPGDELLFDYGDFYWSDDDVIHDHPRAS